MDLPSSCLVPCCLPLATDVMFWLGAVAICLICTPTCPIRGRPPLSSHLTKPTIMCCTYLQYIPVRSRAGRSGRGSGSAGADRIWAMPHRHTPEIHRFPTNVIYPSSGHHPPLIPLRFKTTSPLPHAGGINTEDDQKFSPGRG